MRLVDRLTDTNPCIEAVVDFHRADQDAVPAAITGRFIDIPRVFFYGDAEMTNFAIDLLNLGACVDGDVGVTGHVHHLGGEDAHGAVIRGKRLVQLCHVAADGRLALDEVDMDAMGSDIERSLDACYSRPDNNHVTHGVRTPLQAGHRMRHYSGCAAVGMHRPA